MSSGWARVTVVLFLGSGCVPEAGIAPPMAAPPHREQTTASAAPAPQTAQEAPAPDAPPELASGLKGNSAGCTFERSPLQQPSATQQAAIANLAADYPLAGRWGHSLSPVSFSPADTPFSGTLQVSLRDAPLQQVTGCNRGIEVPVNVTLTTEDGALDEHAEGIALLTNGDEVTVDGSPYPYLFTLEASFDLTMRRGDLHIEENPEWTFERSMLRASLTPFGTRGELRAGAAARDKQPNRAVPAPESMLSWPAAAEPKCGNENLLLVARESAHQTALHEAIERVATERYDAHYEDGAQTTVAVRFDAPSVACGESRVLLPTQLHLETSDGRIAVSVPVFLDTSYARLHANSRTDVPWAFRTTELAAHGVNVRADLSGFTHAGIETFFDEAPEPAAWIKLLSYRAGDCLNCSDECIECSFERRTEALAVYLDE